jgi:hypothetical protein
MYNDRQSGSQIINVKVDLELSEGVQIEFENVIEISLDCAVCLARRRTVKVIESQEYGTCVKTNHQFPIKINSKSSKIVNNKTEVIYQIKYWYSPFFDRKHYQESQVLPTWGRINFILTCPRCLQKKENSLQTNLVRPFTQHCECGFLFYTEKEVMPIFEEVNE